MPRTRRATQPEADYENADSLQTVDDDEVARREAPFLHVFGDHFVCKTDVRGHPTPEDKDVNELVLNAPEGAIRLWARDVTLGWRFQEQSMTIFKDPDAAKKVLRGFMSDALLAWGADVLPIKFAERHDQWDFEVVVLKKEDCDINGCVLAASFFPDSGRHELTIYPTLFKQTRKEIIETLAHEFGHVFGLRHFFALISEKDAPAKLFGKQSAFTIMNYGPKSRLTADDKADLKRLYQAAWKREIRSSICCRRVRLPHSTATS